MKRFKLFDPPEYVNWKPHPEAMRAFRAPLAPAAAAREVASLPTPLLLGFYAHLVRTRLYDIMLKRWVKQGVLSKAWLGTGEEAVTVGNVSCLEDGDVVGPMIRNAGASIMRGIPIAECFRTYLATQDSSTRGRDLHVGDAACGVIGPTSMVGSLVAVLAGAAFAMRRAGGRRVAMTWIGDGASRTGEFHEGMGLAATLGVPLVLVLQNNQIALGTRTATHLKGPLDSMARTYGVEGFACDGNNVIDTYLVTRRAVARCRAGKGPVIIVASTFRMGSHATHDEAEARRLFSAAEFQHWGQRDPIGVYEEWLIAGERELGGHVADDGAVLGEGAAGAPSARASAGGRSAAARRPAKSAKSGGASAPARGRAERNRAALERIEARVTAEIDAAAAEALASREKPFTHADAVEGVYESP